MLDPCDVGLGSMLLFPQFSHLLTSIFKNSLAMPVTCSTFEVFPLLPIELRNHIFAAAIQPRLVTCYYNFQSPAPIPALLHTCQESRRTLQLCGYELAFAAPNEPPKIWFNFKYDVLEAGVGELPLKDRIRIERIAIPEGFNDYNVPEVTKIMPEFGRLEELMWIVHMQFPRDTPTERHETEGNLLGYLECDTADFMNSEFSKYASDSWEDLSRDLIRYRRVRGGSSDGFLASLVAEYDTEMRKYKGAQAGQWAVPAVKYVFVVTRRQAGQILASRKKFLEEMTDVERWERQFSNAPFDDEIDVLRELEINNASYYSDEFGSSSFAHLSNNHYGCRIYG